MFRTARTVWVTFGEGWGRYDVGRVAEQTRDWDPTRRSTAGRAPASALTATPSWTSTAALAPLGRRTAPVSGEYGGLGQAVPGPACSARQSYVWSVQQSYVGVDPGPCTDDGLAKIDKVRGPGVPGRRRRMHSRTSDVEGELNGWLTSDRQVRKHEVRGRRPHTGADPGPVPGYARGLPGGPAPTLM